MFLKESRLVKEFLEQLLTYWLSTILCSLSSLKSSLSFSNSAFFFSLHFIALFLF